MTDQSNELGLCGDCKEKTAVGGPMDGKYLCGDCANLFLEKVQPRPLSETHPKLCEKMHPGYWKKVSFVADQYLEVLPTDIQSCTVDVAEHGRVVAELNDETKLMVNEAHAMGKEDVLRRVREATERLKLRLWHMMKRRKQGRDGGYEAEYLVESAFRDLYPLESDNTLKYSEGWELGLDDATKEEEK